MARATGSMSSSGLRLDQHGAKHFAAAVDARGLKQFEEALATLPTDQAGIRLHGLEPLRPLLSASSAAADIATSILGSGCRPVRALLFDKTPSMNWALAWHQDRTIAVTERREVPGFGPWTVKAGLQHVEPPFALLQSMITLRIHLDPVWDRNAPLLIAPGSHRLGRVAERDMASVVARCGTYACVAQSGDIWCYATPILHASSAAEAPSRRRVLQVDYSSSLLPGGLNWLGL